MNKTTVYLPDDLRDAVKHAARARKISEAEVIRDSIRAAVGGARPRPRGALFSGDGEPIAEHIDEWMAGFGTT
ncbi:MAG: CopG family transcriptional regulator [Sporichthyaceae bacterium]